MVMRWTSVVLTIAVFAALASAAPAPAPPPDPQIAYKVSGTRDKIMVMNNDGSNKTVVYTGPRFAVVSEPTWKPDGTAIAFTVSGLYRLVLSTGVATLLLTNAQCGSSCWNPRFSPSGTRIAVIDAGNQDLGAPPRVLSIPSTGGTPQVLYTGSVGMPFFDVAWSADETKIAVVETVGGGLPDRIVVVDLPTGTRTTVVEGPFDRINSIDWGHVGAERIVFDAGNVPDRTVYTIDVGVTGASPVLVTQGAHASYSPDNASIVYVKGSGTSQKVTTRNLITGAEVELVKGLGPDWKK